MRHGKKFNHLGRTKSHRKAMLSNMACSLIQHKRINTTLAKAKALRVFVEPLITKSKDDSTHSRRVVFSYLNDKYAVTELFREVAPKIGERPGGYTRIIKTGNRMGDNAEMCLIELVDFNELYSTEKKAPIKKRRRRRGGSAEGSAVTQDQNAKAEESKTTESVANASDIKSEGKAEKLEEKKEAIKAEKEEPKKTTEGEERSTDEEKKD